MTLLLVLMACGPDLTTNETKDTDFDDGGDVIPPVVETTAVSEAQPFGVDIPITATVTDDASGIFLVTLYYRNEDEGSDAFRAFGMTANGDVYEGRIRGEDHQSGGIDYYIEAIDGAQNSAFAPEDGADEPFHIRLYSTG